MKVCVVGGNGNIGASVVRALLACNHEVVCFNRGLSGAIPAGAALMQGDRNERDAFERRIRAEGFDAAIDLVCFDRAAADSSIRAFRGVRHFIQCSSVATYGRQLEAFPATEDHPIKPQNDYGRGKAEADDAFLAAYKAEGFPATVVKPSITFGPKMGLLRQIGLDTIWLSRIRRGEPIVVCGDGLAIHQFMHADDAGLAFAAILGAAQCMGQVYNLAPRGFTRWDQYHLAVMDVLGRRVEMVGVPAADLLALRDSGLIKITDVFAHNSLFSVEKLARDVPDFAPRLTLSAALADVIVALDREGRIVEDVDGGWEDRLIAAQGRVRAL